MKALLYLVVGICSLIGAPSIHATEAAACPSPSERIMLQVATITLDEDRNKKIQDTENLIRLVAALNPTEIESVDQRVIMLLAHQLEEPDNGVRMWVATALAEFGYRAEPALPVLDAAYHQTIDKPISDDLPLLPSTSARIEIGNAINVIKQESEREKRNKGGGVSHP